MGWPLTLLNDVADVLTANDVLLILMGGNPAARGEWVYNGIAEEDAKFPYLVQAFGKGKPDDAPALGWGPYTIDVWVQVPIEEDGGLLDYTETRITDICAAIAALLERENFTNSVYGWARFNPAFDAYSLPTDNENIQHYTIPFDVRYSRQSVIESVLAR